MESNEVPSTLIIPRLLRIQDVAPYLSSTTWFVEELIRNNKIRFLIVGKRRVIDVEDLNKWIEQQKRNPSQMAAELPPFDGFSVDDDGNYEIRLRLDCD